MKKLNNKGYLTIEIILSAVIAFTIAFFLIEVTVNFSNASDNYYTDTIFITDKALVSDNVKKSIQNDINEKGIITNVSCANNTCTLTYNDSTTEQLKYNSDNKKVEYSVFSKGIKRVNFKSLSVCDSTGCSSDVTNNYTEGDYIRFVISFDNVFEKNNYDINILIYNGNTETHELLVDYITDLYDNAEKTVVTHNGIDYNYATSVGLMNDRLGGTTKSLNGGNIRYYGNYVVGGVTEEESDGYIEKKNWVDLSEGNFSDVTSEECMQLLYFNCNIYQKLGFSSMEECDLEFHRVTDVLKQEYGYNSFDDYVKDYIKELSGGKYSTVEEVCSVTKLYYKGLNNYIDIGDKYEEDFVLKNWTGYFYTENARNPEECREMVSENNLTSDDIGMGGLYYYGKTYNSVDELCSETIIPKGTSILYRIIGVFDGKVRVRRDVGIGPYSFDTWSREESHYYDYSDLIDKWSDSDLMKLLNPGYENNREQTCLNCKYNHNYRLIDDYDADTIDCNCTDNNVNNSLWYNSESGYCYNGKNNKAVPCDFSAIGLSPSVQNKIVDQTVYYGGIESGDLPEQVFSNERASIGNDENNLWIGKVSLPYPSDFAYAVDFNNCNNTKISNGRKACSKGSYYDCTEYNWMSEGTSWTLTNSYGAVGITQERILFAWSNIPINSWPVLTLDSSLMMVGGNGSKNNPYLLEGVKYVPGEINPFDQKLSDLPPC